MNILEKQNIAKQIKNISLKFLDYYFHVERLSTVGAKGISFFTFVKDFEIYRSKWPSINRLYENLRHKHPTNFYKCLKEIYQLYWGTINAFRPIVAMKIYDRYQPNNVLNVCSGWGGFVIGAAAMNIPKITAIDNNPNLLQPYTDMIQELNKCSSTDITFINNNVLILDISNNLYDMVICSPPYYNKEIYGHLPAPYDTKHEWNESFYKPLFKGVYELLEPNGKMVINVPIEIYEACLVPLFGDANEHILLPRYQRNNKYKEYIYVWMK